MEVGGQGPNLRFEKGGLGGFQGLSYDSITMSLEDSE